MAGYEKVDESRSLVLRVSSLAGSRLHADIPLKPSSVGNNILLGSFTPPSSTFKFVMHGTTKSGLQFERESSSSITATDTFLSVTQAGDGFTTKAYPRGATRITINVHTNGRKYYNLRATVDNKVGSISYGTRNTWINGKYVHSFTYYTRGVASDKGKTAVIYVTAITGGKTTSLPVSVLLV